MKSIVLFIFITFSFAARAQKIPYEKIDLLSDEINRLQLTAEGLKYTEGNESYQTSFAVENFKVYYNDLLLTHSVYKKSGNKEVMELTENIDLSKVTAIRKLTSSNDIGRVLLEFPANSIKKQVYENGELIKTTSSNSIDVYAGKQLYDLYEKIVLLSHSLKKEKNNFSYNVEEVTTSWKVVKETNSLNSYQSFLKKHPNTLFESEVKNLVALKEREIQEEKDRLEKIRVEKEKIRIAEELERARIEQERLAAIAEEVRKKALRNIEFGSFRIGYVMPTDEMSKSLASDPSLTGSFSVPYRTGGFGLDHGLNAGFTGIVNLEFINRHTPSWIGIGLPMDLNFALMKYSWKPLGKDMESYAFMYEDAKYGMWGVLSAGIGLSVTVHPAKSLFIDILARPDFYLTTGGKYTVEGEGGGVDYNVETKRTDNSSGIGKTIGLNIRYKRIILGFEARQDIEDKAEWKERIQSGSSNTLNVVLHPALNLDHMQMTIGYKF